MLLRELLTKTKYMLSIKHLDFLEKLMDMTVTYYDMSVIPNITSKTFQIKKVGYTRSRISLIDFKSVLAIIKEGCLLVLPHVNKIGSIDGYIISDVRGNVLLMFGEDNIPEKYSLQSFFVFCHTKQNKGIIKALSETNDMMTITLLDTFEAYGS